MHFAASSVPIMRETKVLQWEPGKGTPEELEVADAFALMEKLKPGDILWLTMGSTNAPIALGAYHQRVTVRQISFSRAMPLVRIARQQESDEGESNGRIRISPQDIYALATGNSDLFYYMHPMQTEVLEISSAWSEVDDAMEARKAYANLVRSRLQRQAVTLKQVRGKPISTSEELDEIIEHEIGVKDKEGHKKKPNDPHMQAFMEEEEKARARLQKIVDHSELCEYILGSVQGVGPMIAARFIAAIERIENFTRPEDLSNYAGMLPRGKSGKMPSARNAKSGKIPLSRSPLLNMACFLLQDQMFTYGANTELGQMIRTQVNAQCPCTAEQRKKDKELRRKHAEAVKQARIAMTRYFLEKIVWPRWKEYLQAKQASAS